MQANISTLFGFSRPGHSLRQRWRTLATLLASVVIMSMAAWEGYQGAERVPGADWANLMIYVCGAVIVAMQVDRLLRH